MRRPNGSHSHSIHGRRALRRVFRIEDAHAPASPSPPRALLCGALPAIAMGQIRLYRDPANGKLGGVAAGIADSFGWDVTLVRVAWVILVLLAGTGVLAYLLLWFVMPKKEDTLPAGPALTDETPAR